VGNQREPACTIFVKGRFDAIFVHQLSQIISALLTIAMTRSCNNVAAELRLLSSTGLIASETLAIDARVPREPRSASCDMLISAEFGGCRFVQTLFAV
jgi:hypothetical protein